MKTEQETQFFNKVYDILVNLAGAQENERNSFIHSHLTENAIKNYGICQEWRFCGHFGFGGKYRSGRNQIDYYRENETPRLEALLKEVNDALNLLDAKF